MYDYLLDVLNICFMTAWRTSQFLKVMSWSNNRRINWQPSKLLNLSLKCCSEDKQICVF